MKKTFFQLVIAMLAMASMAACSGNKAESESNEETTEAGHEHEGALPEGYVQLTPVQWKTIGGTLVKPELRQISGTITASGKLDVPPQNTITVTALLGGVVRYTKVLEGMRVSKGERLVTIHNPDLPDLQRRYVAAMASSTQLGKELERQKELRRDEVNAAKTLEQARASYQTAEAEAKSLALQLESIGIRPSLVAAGQFTDEYHVKAPISGFVSHISINLGQRLSASDPVFDIVDTEHLHAELAVFERDIYKLKKGQRIRFTLPSQNERELTATVYLIGKSLEPDRTVRVHGHLDTEDPGLVPGLYLQATVETGGEKGLVVPSQALIREGGKTFVYVPGELPADEYAGKQEADHEEKLLTFKKVEVIAGESTGSMVAIRPLDANQDFKNVVNNGAFFVNSTLKQAQGGEEGEGHGH